MRTDKELLIVWKNSRTDKGWELVYDYISYEERQRIFDLVSGLAEIKQEDKS